MIEQKQRKPLDWFLEICKIPHKSKDEQALSHMLLEFAQQRGLECARDSAYNVLIWKKGTEGREMEEPVILQGHIDMVFESIDYEKYPYAEPLRVCIDGDEVFAEGTSLGADNGLGVGMILSVLDSEDLSHPPIEALFTTDEESGLIGVKEISSEWLTGTRLINLDGEVEDEMIAGCAGAFRGEIQLPIQKTNEQFQHLYKIKISGLAGGHSGLDIAKGFLNANKFMGELLAFLEKEVNFRICDMEGGTRMNSIPTKASVIVATKEDEKKTIENIISKAFAATTTKLIEEDKNLCVAAEKIDDTYAPWSEATTRNVQKVLKMIPNGMLEMNQNIANRIDTSTNLGHIQQVADKVLFISNPRSTKKQKLEEMKLDMQEIAEQCGGVVVFDSAYPPWEYQEVSELRQKYAEVFAEIFGSSPKTELIHGGLECGMLLEKYPEMDAISIGPNIKAVHSVSENFSISSLDRIWMVLQCVLEHI